MVASLLDEEKKLRELAYKLQKDYTVEEGIYIADEEILDRLSSALYCNLHELRKRVRDIKLRALDTGNTELYDIADTILMSIDRIDWIIGDLRMTEIVSSHRFVEHMMELYEVIDKLSRDVKRLEKLLR